MLPCGIPVKPGLILPLSRHSLERSSVRLVMGELVWSPEIPARINVSSGRPLRMLRGATGTLRAQFREPLGALLPWTRDSIDQLGGRHPLGAACQRAVGRRQALSPPRHKIDRGGTCTSRSGPYVWLPKMSIEALGFGGPDAVLAFDGRAALPPGSASRVRGSNECRWLSGVGSTVRRGSSSCALPRPAD